MNISLSSMTTVSEVELRAQAERSARRTGLEADDLFQEFFIVLIENHQQYHGKTKSYILQSLAWKASHLGEADTNRHRLDQPLVWRDADGDEDEMDVVDPQGLTPEEIIIAQETRVEQARGIRAALAELSPRQARIARALMDGEQKRVVAARCGISAPMVTKEVAAIRRALAE